MIVLLIYNFIYYYKNNYNSYLQNLEIQIYQLQYYIHKDILNIFAILKYFFETMGNYLIGRALINCNIFSRIAYLEHY